MGPFADGSSCVQTVTNKITRLSISETMDFLTAQEARHCVPKSDLNVCADDQTGVAKDLPARAAAIFRSSDDELKLHTVLETACRELGPACTYEMKAQISAHRNQLNALGVLP